MTRPPYKGFQLLDHALAFASALARALARALAVVHAPAPVLAAAPALFHHRLPSLKASVTLRDSAAHRKIVRIIRLSVDNVREPQ